MPNRLPPVERFVLREVIPFSLGLIHDLLGEQGYHDSIPLTLPPADPIEYYVVKTGTFSPSNWILPLFDYSPRYVITIRHIRFLVYLQIVIVHFTYPGLLILNRHHTRMIDLDTHINIIPYGF